MKRISDEKFIFDNAILSNFARINRLELIFYISEDIFTTKEVIGEVKRGIKNKPNLEKIIDFAGNGKIKILSVENMENILLMSKLMDEGILGAGEISAMVLARELDGIFITDDKVATKKASLLDIKILDNKEYRDTVTFLLMFKKNKIISEEEYNLIKSNLHDERFIF